MNIQELAATASGYFEERDGRTYRKDGAPEWVKDLVFAAHYDKDGDSMLPDDHKYRFVVEALDDIAEHGDDDTHLEADMYLNNLTKWLDSHAWRAAYCDEAVEEYDSHEWDMFRRMSAGQLQEKLVVREAVIASLESELETETALERLSNEQR